MNEIKVRKPRTIKWFGLNDKYNKYSGRWYKWYKALPDNGDRIKITWFPNNNGEPNAYIGMEGVVESMDKNKGSFVLNCGNCYLCNSGGNFNYILL